MPRIHLTTLIKAPPQIVFDLSRSIDFHTNSMAHTNEVAIDGVTSGLISINETVTWQARHLFKKRFFTSKITAMNPYLFFEDTMVAGDFTSFRHGHHFKQIANGTIMIDLLFFETPYGKPGHLVNALYLKNYLQKLITKRNKIIKTYAETGKWKQVLIPLDANNM